jgi:hypothetical protein
VVNGYQETSWHRYQAEEYTVVTLIHSVPALWQKLRGHFGYYGVIGNLPALLRFRYEVICVWRKSLSRRRRGGWWPWTRMAALLRYFPLPVPRAGAPPCALNP